MKYEDTSVLNITSTTDLGSSTQVPCKLYGNIHQLKDHYKDLISEVFEDTTLVDNVLFKFSHNDFKKPKKAELTSYLADLLNCVKPICVPDSDSVKIPNNTQTKSEYNDDKIEELLSKIENLPNNVIFLINIFTLNKF